MLPIDLSKIYYQFLYHPKEPLLFTSGFFLFLFSGFMLIYFVLHKHHRVKATFVTLFSLYFYYKSSGIYFLLLIMSTVIDYLLANLIYHTKSKVRKTIILIFSLLLNLGLLGYFKYTNFFYELYCDISQHTFSPLHIFLPVGVSFFTFQSLSYTIDIYRGTLKPVRNILDYAFFVTFFPQLVAGPIVRASDFIPQIFKPIVVTEQMISRASFLILGGIVKKVIIADYISINFVDRIFDNPTLFTGLENLIGVYGYALQIYCDFSGYSDMAIGIALLMGFHFNTNFNTPYQSRNITEFWRRWHISLSTWLKDYLYISLGGNRKGKFRTYLNLFITMLLGGLWHGAGLRFVLWGALHGMALGIHKFYLELFPSKKVTKHKSLRLMSRFLNIIITFNFVCFCWIFFRAENMTIAKQVLNQIAFHFNAHIFVDFVLGYKLVVLLILFGYGLHFISKSIKNYLQQTLASLPLLFKVFIFILIIIITAQFKSAQIQPFIYFQF